jgi:hypothetical protein
MQSEYQTEIKNPATPVSHKHLLDAAQVLSLRDLAILLFVHKQTSNQTFSPSKGHITICSSS